MSYTDRSIKETEETLNTLYKQRAWEQGQDCAETKTYNPKGHTAACRITDEPKECSTKEDELARIKDFFTYHNATPDQVAHFTEINRAFENAALVALDHVPGYDYEMVLQHLSMARMIANRGIARRGRR